MRIVLAAIALLALLAGEGTVAMAKQYSVHPVGKVVKEDHQTALEILPAYQRALLGLEGFSHAIVLYWFDRNDTQDKRAVVMVHPRADPRNPLTGVFATRSPVRPNLIGFSVCRIKSVQGLRILVDEIDAFDQTPILDLKPYIPASDCVSGATVPEWVRDRETE
jgi:tRNA-Thr(GGU) m(6)t(6)A37 methyltransferase TsaA